MSKDEVVAKIKAILAKDKHFNGVDLKVKFADKKKCQKPYKTSH